MIEEGKTRMLEDRGGRVGRCSKGPDIRRGAGRNGRVPSDYNTHSRRGQNGNRQGSTERVIDRQAIGWDREERQKYYEINVVNVNKGAARVSTKPVL